MTPIEAALKVAFRGAMQPLAGVKMTADTGEQCVATIEDQQVISDPSDIVRAKLPIYAHIETDSDAIENPRNVKVFTENESGRTHRVLKYLPQASDRFTDKWLVETQRT